MLIIQDNCRQGYESIVMALETVLSIGAGIVMLQESFIGNWEICHSTVIFWPEREKN